MTGVTGEWITRREFHPGAPQIDDLVGDVSGIEAGHVDCKQLTSPTGSWFDAERLWERFLTNGIRWPAFRLVRDGKPLPRSQWTRQAPVGSQRVDDLIEPNHVLELYTRGATVVLQALQFSDPLFGELSTNVALALDQPVQVNAYLSPRGARGLEIHFDYHDVVVVQLAGAKRWRVWEPLPRSARPLKRGPAIAQPTVGELGGPLVDRLLKAGECMSIPRGFPHAAETVDEESAHLTIGLMALTWNRVLRDRIDQVASGTALADRIVFGRSGAAMSALQEALGEDDLRYAVAEDVWRRQPRTRLRPRQVVTIDATDRFRVTPGPLLWLDRRAAPGAKHALGLGDRQLRFPSACSPFVEAILRSDGPIAAADVRCRLDLASRLVVLRRLAVEGVVVRA